MQTHTNKLAWVTVPFLVWPCKTELRSQTGLGCCVFCFLFFSLSPVSSHHFPIPLLTLWNISIIVLWSVTACAGLPHTPTHTHTAFIFFSPLNLCWCKGSISPPNVKAWLPGASFLNWSLVYSDDLFIRMHAALAAVWGSGFYSLVVTQQRRHSLVNHTRTHTHTLTCSN